MANYIARTRTNYFKVKDIKAFREEMEKFSSMHNIEVWEKEIDGEIRVAFGGYDSLVSVFPDEEALEPISMEGVIRPHLEEGEACIIFEVGHEKLRYLTGEALVITQNATKYVNLTDVAIKSARKLLKRSDITFHIAY